MPYMESILFYSKYGSPHLVFLFYGGNDMDLGFSFFFNSILLGIGLAISLGLVLRAGASTSSAIVGYLSYGTKVTVHRVTTSGWAKVTANGKTGYVSARYLTASNPNTAASTTIMYVKT